MFGLKYSATFGRCLNSCQIKLLTSRSNHSRIPRCRSLSSLALQQANSSEKQSPVCHHPSIYVIIRRYASRKNNPLQSSSSSDSNQHCDDPFDDQGHETVLHTKVRGIDLLRDPKTNKAGILQRIFVINYYTL